MASAKADIKPIAIIAAATVFALALIVAATTYSLELWGGKTIPDETGAVASEARDRLGSAGFASIATRDAYTDDLVGKVMAIDPKPGTRIDPNDTVTLEVGVARTIPALEGATEEDARGALEERGATNVQVIYVNSDLSKGTVISVEPAAGSTFKAADPIIIRVAQPYTVPDVAGLSYEDAAQAIAEAGLSPVRAFVDSQSQQNVVVGSEPKAGTELHAGSTVTLQVGVALPSNVYHLASYFSMPREAIPDYLASQRFIFWGGLSQSAPYDQGKGNCSFFNGDTMLYFGSSPYSHHIAGVCRDADDNPLSKGRAFDGIRLALPASNPVIDSFSPDRTSAAKIATICGLGGESDITESCTFDDIVCPNIDNARKSQYTREASGQFYCAYGETGNLCWTVLINKPSSSGGRAVVTVQPKSLYPADLSEYGNSICNFVAYCDMFTE